MSNWDSSNHFKCIHYQESSWCSKMKSRIWENDPCPDYQSYLAPPPRTPIVPKIYNSEFKENREQAEKKENVS